MVAVQTVSNVSGQCVRAGKTQPFLDNELRNALRVHVMDVGPMTIQYKYTVLVLIVLPMHPLIFEIFVRAKSCFNTKLGILQPNTVTLRRHHFVWGERTDIRTTV